MRILTSLALAAIATCAFAQGELSPSGGAYYPDDAMNQGYITATFDESVDAPAATVTVGNVAHEAAVEPVGFSGTTYRVNVADVMDGKAANTPFTLAVGTLSGNYVWQPQFPLAGVSPASGSELDSKAQTVKFTFSPAVSYDGIRLTSGAVITDIDKAESNVTSVTVTLSEDQWGAPVGGVNSMTVALLNVTANGVSISNASGSVGTILANYSVAEQAATVTFLGVDPEEDWATAEELWDYWNVVFKFSDAVTLTDDETTAVIKFYRKGGVELEDYTINVPTSEIYADWNYRSGFYGVEVPAPELPADLPGTFAYLTISLQGIAYNGTILAEQPSATYQKILEYSVRSNAKGAMAGVVSSWAVESDNVNVYNIQGILVKENIERNAVSFLPSGLYIIDGKKVVIK